ncbi:hypothetical protein OC834_002108 [Tilletia horrida]|uniref:Chitin-binding type-4 domain-containing protein n=1 Tax=Tilletia horrida TaxID=155126 RepID=A0AAN6JJ28_9BASI|nr:hypothetical protein OC835_005078 [Tilletia horrida]KAK0527985.1 hypothetical protein OC842_004685 [Tilletia horrida]KAK0533779.1 hypothetical protein OC834_002108 [Tilletia horrida]KAK0562581.1 hypothetical protein OC844_002647 [Tilletia horrida]
MRSILALLAASLLASSASATNSPSSSSECSSTPAVICIPIKTGVLVGADVNGTRRNGAFEGSIDQNGNPILDLGFYGETSPAQQFTFNACASTYTGWDPVETGSNTTFYGTLHPAKNKAECVKASRWPYEHYTTALTSAACSTADDASQLPQTWSLSVTRNATGAHDYSLTFIGARKSDPSTGSQYGFTAYWAAERPVNALVPFLFYAPPSQVVDGQFETGTVYKFSLV